MWVSYQWDRTPVRAGRRGDSAPWDRTPGSQVDVAIKGNTGKLVEEMRGFHWMACYGDHLKETGYALKKAGVDWLVV
jgi:hypothetical protein